LASICTGKNETVLKRAGALGGIQRPDDEEIRPQQKNRRAPKPSKRYFNRFQSEPQGHVQLELRILHVDLPGHVDPDRTGNRVIPNADPAPCARLILSHY
jgi:hypothetical protein